MTQEIYSIDIIVSMQRPLPEHNLINLSNDNISDLMHESNPFNKIY